MRVLTVGLVVAVVGVAGAQEWPHAVAAEGAALEKLSGAFRFTEGPAPDAEGNVYFTDQPNDRIMIWTVDDTLETWMQPCGRSNGLYFDADWNLWACADEKNEMWRISKDKEVEKLFSTYNNKLLNAPNDLWITPTGAIYFTDPFYKRDYWTRGPSEQDVQGVYYVALGSTTPVRVVGDIVQPNGIVGTPDGKTLYVADIGDKKIYRYAIQKDGTLTGRVLFCHQGSDGMTIDTEGNIYLTGNGVLVFNPEGEQIDHVRVPEPWTANVCFGGPDRKALYITSSTALYRLRTRTQGVKP